MGVRGLISRQINAILNRPTIAASLVTSRLIFQCLCYLILGNEPDDPRASYIVEQSLIREFLSDEIKRAIDRQGINIILIKNVLRYKIFGRTDPRIKGLLYMGRDMLKWWFLRGIDRRARHYEQNAGTSALIAARIESTKFEEKKRPSNLNKNIDPAAINIVSDNNTENTSQNVDETDTGIINKLIFIRDILAFERTNQHDDPEVEVLWAFASSFLSNKGGVIEPVGFSIDITPKCNKRCDFGGEKCYFYANEEEDWAWNQKEGLSLSEWRETITDFQDEYRYARTATFVGGEPLYRKDDILTLADEFFAGVHIVSNGTHPRGFFEPEEYQDIDSDFSFMISLDGAREHHDSNRGEGSFDEALETIQKTNAPVGINASIGPPIMDGMDDLVEAVEGPVDNIRFSGWTPRIGNEHFTDHQQQTFVDRLHELKDQYGDLIENTRTEIELMRPVNQQYAFEKLCPIRAENGEPGLIISLGYNGERKGMCVMDDGRDPKPDCSECLCDVVPGAVSAFELAATGAVDMGATESTASRDLTDQLCKLVS